MLRTPVDRTTTSKALLVVVVAVVAELLVCTCRCRLTNTFDRIPVELGDLDDDSVASDRRPDRPASDDCFRCPKFPKVRSAIHKRFDPKRGVDARTTSNERVALPSNRELTIRREF